MTSLIALLTLAGPGAPPSHKHTVFLVDTSGSAYRLGYLRDAYVPYISSELNRLLRTDEGGTVTCIAYDGNAGFYPASFPLESVRAVLSPIRDQIYATRRYWGKINLEGKRKDLESSERGGTRLDLALELLMRERRSWKPDATVTIHFLTDGGVDFRRGVLAGKSAGDDVRKAVDTIQNDMRALWRDRRVKSVYVCGLKEQTGNVFPSQVFGPRSIVEQWRLNWLKDAPDLHPIKFGRR